MDDTDDRRPSIFPVAVFWSAVSGMAALGLMAGAMRLVW